MRIRHSLSANALGVAITAVAGFAAMLVLARRLPVEVFGTVSIALMVANAVSVFDGVRPVVVFEATRTDVSLLTLSRSVRRLLRWTGAVATVLTLTIAATLWREQIGLLGVALLGLTVFLYFPAASNWGFLDARNDTAFTGVVRSIAWVTVYVAFVLLAFVTSNPVWYLLPLAIMNAALVLVYHLRVGRLPSRPGARAPSARELLRRSMDNLGANVAAATIGTIDRVVLSAVSGMRDVGLYSAQYELSTKPAALMRVASSVLFPAAASLHAEGKDIALPWLRMTLGGSQAIVAAVCLVVGMRRPLVGMMLGPAFVQYADVFGLLMIALAIQFYGYACPVLLYARGDFALQRRLYLFAAIVMIICVAPIASSFGILGLAALYLVVRTVDLVMFLMTLRLVRLWPRPGLLPLHFAVAALVLSLAWTGRLVPTLLGLVTSAAAALAFLRLPSDRLVHR